MSEPIRAPRRHRIFFKVEAVLFRFLLRYDPMVARYVCPACLKLDHEHCEGANGHPSLCQCDDPDPAIHLHAHPHDPSNYWPYPGATKPVEGEYNPELADIYALADELVASGEFEDAPWDERLHEAATE